MLLTGSLNTMLIVVVVYFEVDLFDNISLIITVYFNPFAISIIHAGRTLLHPDSLLQVPTSSMQGY